MTGYYRAAVVFALSVVCLWPQGCFAYTVSGVHEGITKWTKDDGLVTVVGDVEFSEGSTLIVEAGVQIEIDDDVSFFSAGTVIIRGTEGEPVTLRGGMFSVEGTISAEHASFEQMRDVSFYGADVRFRSVVGTQGAPVSMYHSRAQIEDSVFTAGSTDAFGLYDWSEALISSSTFMGAGDSAGLAIYNSFVDVRTSHFCAEDVALAVYAARRNQFDRAGALVRGSEFCQGALVYADDRFRDDQVDVRSNWWGVTVEPRVLGPALTSPWLHEDPFVMKPAKTTLFFLPGIEASRLYATNTFLGDENQLWEPNRNADVSTLFFATSGQPLPQDYVYTRDIIDEVNSVSTFAGGSPNIYKSLITQFDSLVENGVLGSWHPLPYDWRYSAKDVALRVLEYIHTVPIHSERIVFVAHSNGGLVLRHLIDVMRAAGDPLLEKVAKTYFVAVPQEGTPQAALSLLYGHSLALLGGLILKSSVAQHLAETIPGAYGLLPTVSLVSVLKQKYRANNFDFLGDAFLVGSPTGHATPVILERIRAEQQIINRQLDVPAVNVVGEGIRTVYGLDFVEVDTCKSSRIESYYIKGACSQKKKTIMLPLTTESGDGTVLSESANILPGARVQNIYFDMKGYNTQSLTIDRKHADITEAAPVLTFLKNELSGISSNVPFMDTSMSSTSTSASARRSRALMVSVHSPVVIDMYTMDGAHTGRLPDPTNFETASTIFYETGIPGSAYWEIGESKYILLPESAFADGVRLELRGVGTGLATLVFDSVDGDEVVWRRIVEDVPTMPALRSGIEVGMAVFGQDFSTDSLIATTTFPGGTIATSTLADLAASTGLAIQRHGPVAYCRNRQTDELEPKRAQR